MKRFVVDEEGQGMTEYAVILALIVAIAVGLTLTLGDKITAIFTRIGAKLDTFTF